MASAAGAVTAASTSAGYSAQQRSVLRDLVLRHELEIRLDLATAQWLHLNGLAARAEPLVAEADDDARSYLQRAAQRSRLRSLMVASQTSSLQEELRSLKIPALFYKGAALGAALGEDQGERPAADIDVLVPWGAIESVDQALVRAGHRLKPRYRWMPPWLERRLECERTYSGPRITVDLHWWVDTGKSMRGDFASLWSGRSVVTLGGVQVDTLGTDDALLVTAVHGCRELWGSGKWIVDAGRQVLAVGPEGLQSAAARADVRGCRKALDATVAMVGQLGLSGPGQTAEPSRRSARWAAAALAGEYETPSAGAGTQGGIRRHRARGAVVDRRSAAVSRAVLGASRSLLGSINAPRPD